MEDTINMSIKIDIHPQNMMENKLSLLKGKYNDQIYKGYHILDVEEIVNEGKGKILNSGHTLYNILAKLKIYIIGIGDVIKTMVSHVNKMGAFCVIQKISVFIPNHFQNKQMQEGDIVDLEIVGKRVQEHIVCIAKEV